MIASMLSRSARSGLILLSVLAAPSASFAQEEEVIKNSRTEGYTPSIELTDGGVAPMYILFSLLLLLTGGVMFMNAKRTHLD
jgi:hypothetical protein